VSSNVATRNGKKDGGVELAGQEGLDDPTMPRSVLVVDDDPTVLAVLADMLEDLGCEVISAANGRDALDQLRRNERISILITDINMPGMDGHELAHLAMRSRPGLKVLQVSGREPRRGGLPMIRKPFSAEDLANMMQQTTGLC